MTSGTPPHYENSSRDISKDISGINQMNRWPDKMSPDKMSRTKCQGQKVVDNMSWTKWHGQNVVVKMFCSILWKNFSEQILGGE